MIDAYHERGSFGAEHRADDIVLELGNSLRQQFVDSYVGGEKRCPEKSGNAS